MNQGRGISKRLSMYAVLVLGGGSLLPMARAASFDCDAARTDVEHAICADDQLGREDERLAEAYGAVRNEMPVADRAGLLREQRAWLRRRDACVAGDGEEATGCLHDAMQARGKELDARLVRVRAAFDEVVASIPADPGKAAQVLSGYDSALAQAWLLYLGRHARQGQLLPKAAALRGQARKALRKADGFAASVLDDVYAAGGDDAEAKGDMTLLRMWIERSYDGDRAYVHCFVFHRQPALAFDTMGALYGSTRDSFAPVCDPEGDLFESAQWSRLREAFEPVIARTHGMDSGSIRFADFAQWRTSDLQLTLTPLDYLDPALYPDYRRDPVQSIEHWADDLEDGYDWPRAARREALDALEEARRVTIEWLETERRLSPAQAAGVAEAFLQIWVTFRVTTAGDAPS